MQSGIARTDEGAGEDGDAVEGDDERVLHLLRCSEAGEAAKANKKRKRKPPLNPFPPRKSDRAVRLFDEKRSISCLVSSRCRPVETREGRRWWKGDEERKGIGNGAEKKREAVQRVDTVPVSV